MVGGVLTDGTWRATNGATLDAGPAGTSITEIGAGASVELGGAGAQIVPAAALQTINGSFTVTDGAEFTTVGDLGGAGDYFDVADTVIGMRRYLPADLTTGAREIAERFRTQRLHEGGTWSPLLARVPDPTSIDAQKGRKPVSIKVQTPTRVLFGTQELELGALEQLVEEAQVRAIAQAMVHATGRWLDGRRTLREALEGLMQEVGEEGLDSIDSRGPGDYARFRIHELAAALGRLRTLRIRAANG